MSSTLGASLLRTVLSDGTLKILGSGLDKGPIILNGADTFPKVKEATKAGTGACGGKGCGPRIVKLLKEMQEK